jgi:hypothetical protein
MQGPTTVLQLFQKTFSRDLWPLILYTSDERFALHQVTNTVNVYDIQDPSQGAAPQLISQLELQGTF